MIIEVLGIRCSGKSTICNLLKEGTVDCRNWDSSLRLGMCRPGGNIKAGEEWFQSHSHLSPYWERAVFQFPTVVSTYKLLVSQLGNVGETPEKRMRTGRKYFVRWLRAKESNSICLWDKGLVQVAAKLFLHDQQYKHFDMDTAVPALMKDWPKSDMYVYLDVDPVIAYERSKGRSKKEWTLEQYVEAKKYMDQIVSHLPVIRYINNGKPEDIVENIRHDIRSCDSS